MNKAHKVLAQAQALSHVGSWELDLTNNRSYWSDEYYRILGITHEQYDNTHESFLKFVHPDDIEIIENLMKNPSAEPVELEFRIIKQDGSVRNIYELMEFVFNENGKPIYLYGTIQDITEKKQLQKEIESKQDEINKMQKRFQVLVQESNDVFEILSPDGTILYISEASEKVNGYKPEERVGKKVYEYYEGEELQKVERMMSSVLNNPDRKVQDDVVIKTKSGKDIHLEIHMQNLLNEPAIEGIVVNFRDITKRIEMEKRLAHIATHDGLTGLPNMIYFRKQLQTLCKRAKVKQAALAVMILDIDGFKYVNDALGYQIGDKLIIKITERLKSYLGEFHFLCRYSGDRFAIIVQNLNTIEEYKSTAEGIAGLLAETFKVEKYELDIDVKIGISIYNEAEQDADLLVKNAEIALFWAKKENKNAYKFYSSDISIQDYKQFHLRSDLRKTLETNQLKVYYQPLVNLRTSDILAAEALIRWEHPDWGIVSPREFISLAEESGFIINIGYWLLGEVCRNYKQWLDEGLRDIKISANFSSIQFFENDFVDNVKSIIDEFDLDPSFLIIEITESILMEKHSKAISDIKRLQSFGIQIALDDFGTGFSSLAYLNTFSIDILKLDGSFIKDIHTNGTNAIITRSIINMARELKIKLVAEGIENWDQLSCLKELKCYAGQGNIYSKAIPPDSFKLILAKRKCKPIIVNNTAVKVRENRRKYYRIKFIQLLEADFTILEIDGKRISVGKTKVLIKDMGPGGLCFISNIRLPVKKGIILQFTTQLLDEDIKVYGYTVRMEETSDDLFEYGVEFAIDENARMDLTNILNRVHVKMNNNVLFAEGSFASTSPAVYFKYLQK